MMNRALKCQYGLRFLLILAALSSCFQCTTATATTNAFREFCLKSLDASSPAASILCNRLGVPYEPPENPLVGDDEWFQTLLGCLQSVPLEDFVDSIRESAPSASFCKFRFDLTAPAIEALSDEIISRWRQFQDSVANVPPGMHTFENTVLTLARATMKLYPLETSVTFPQRVHPKKEIRDASMAAAKKLSAFSVESAMRKDVFNSLTSFEGALISKGIVLDPESQRLLDRCIRGFRRCGLELSEEARHKFAKNEKEIANMRIQFQRNLSEEDTKIIFTSGELDGMNDDFLSKLTPVENRPHSFFVSLKAPEYSPIMKMCKVEETRRKLEFAYRSRCADENVPLLEQTCALRHENANLLGYRDHASYALETRMARTPETVTDFLKNLNEILQPLADQELNELLELKKKEKAERNEPFDGKINQWDFTYYLNQRVKLTYDFDQETLRMYFPLPVVLKGLFDIYQQLLSLKFTEVFDVPTWHEDVKSYAAYDSQSNSLIGYFYLDLHPRDGKFGHAACFGLQPQCHKSGRDGIEPQVPFSAMVTNFSKPSLTSPALLLHSEVKTLFHEFGHVMHNLCSNVEYAMFSGTRVEKDFVECPSQMLENWCWESTSLAFLSSHVEDGSKIPDDLLKKLVASKTANVGLSKKSQIVLGLFDQHIHSRPSCDFQAVYAELRQRIVGVPATLGTNFAASFAHLVAGYDAKYYGYLWSLVYSSDMFATRFQDGHLLDPAVGSDYRKMILAPGGSRDAMDSIKEFLGREPNQVAFLKALNLK